MVDGNIIRHVNGVNRSNYRVFLVRCWKEIDSSVPVGEAWRFTLVQVGEDERKRGFARLEDLFTFLRDQLENGK